MRSDAESHAEEDRRKFELVEARNQADQMCYQLEKMMKEHDQKLEESDKAPLRKAIEKVREAAKSDDTQQIRSAVSELEQASHALSKVLYEKAQAGPAPETRCESGAAASGDDDAIDAEFEVKNS